MTIWQWLMSDVLIPATTVAAVETEVRNLIGVEVAAVEQKVVATFESIMDEAKGLIAKFETRAANMFAEAEAKAAQIVDLQKLVDAAKLEAAKAKAAADKIKTQVVAN